MNLNGFTVIKKEEKITVSSCMVRWLHYYKIASFKKLDFLLL